ncbi:hypothetical protein ZIOFF_000934 [Zingiber officinale]|uniref:Uncharacterized protein n=1 Tax=Zingiber officinale TaxID=94328 RepID=A0A8J5I570_ZINOF|nr:hypothetical protein ZIOFF_000934 [Zingiber officinale]
MDNLFMEYSSEDMLMSGVEDSFGDQEPIPIDPSQTAQMGHIRDDIASHMWNDYVEHHPWEAFFLSFTSKADCVEWEEIGECIYDAFASNDVNWMICRVLEDLGSSLDSPNSMTEVCISAMTRAGTIEVGALVLATAIGLDQSRGGLSRGPTRHHTSSSFELLRPSSGFASPPQVA